MRNLTARVAGVEAADAAEHNAGRVVVTATLGRYPRGVFDHIGVRVSDLPASERFYRTVLGELGFELRHVAPDLVEWDDWNIGPPEPGHPLTRGLHAGFRAASREQVNAFWHAGVDAGYRDAGAPGPRPEYSARYYGAFLLDPDGNSVDAVYREGEERAAPGCVDHLRIGVRDLRVSRRFYSTIASEAGLRLTYEDSARVELSGPDFTLSLVSDGRPAAEHVHIAFQANDDDTVRAFHAAALAAGYTDNGAPGERAIYHSGYYGAFVLDPDGNNIEVVNHNRC